MLGSDLNTECGVEPEQENSKTLFTTPTNPVIKESIHLKASVLMSLKRLVYKSN